MARNHDLHRSEGRWVGPDLPGLGSIALGTILFATGGMLLLTVIGTPLGIVLFAAGLGMLTTPKERSGSKASSPTAGARSTTQRPG